MKNVLLAVVVFLLAVLVIIIGSQKTITEILHPVPECSDEAVTSMITPLYKDMWKGVASNNSIMLEGLATALTLPTSIKQVDIPHSTGYDEASRSRFCEAMATFEGRLGGGEVTTTIKYIVQVDENNSQLFTVTLLPDFINNGSLQ